MSSGQHSRWSKMRPEESGPGVYRFLIGDALLKASEATMAEDWRFHVSVEWAISLAYPLLKVGGWDDEMKRILVDQDGQPLPPGAPIERRHRYEQVKSMMDILRVQGVFGPKDKPFTKADDVFSTTTRKPKPEPEAGDEDDD